MLRYLMVMIASVAVIPADCLAGYPAGDQCISIAESAPPGSTWITTSDDGAVTVEWCARKPGPPPEEISLLVSVRKPQHPWSNCPKLIPLSWTGGPYPQIRVLKQKPDLYGKPALYRDFMWFDRLGESITIGGIAPGPHIDTGAGDMGQLIICVKGRWAVAGYH